MAFSVYVGRGGSVGKGGCQGGKVGRIPGLMAKRERQVLAKHTPCAEGSVDSVGSALAIVHAELILIHPFRDGNGRLARMLATLMALQARLPALEFSSVEGSGQKAYIAGIHAALDHNFAPLTAVFAQAIGQTRKRAASSNR